MYVCLCKAITDKQINSLIEDEKLRTLSEIANRCKAGTVCGSCVCDLKKTLEEYAQKTAEADDVLFKSARSA